MMQIRGVVSNTVSVKIKIIFVDIKKIKKNCTLKSIVNFINAIRVTTHSGNFQTVENLKETQGDSGNF